MGGENALRDEPKQHEQRLRRRLPQVASSYGKLRWFFPFVYFSLLSLSFSCRTGFYFGWFAALLSQR